MIENAAVFINSKRLFKGVNVEFDAETVRVLNRINGSEIARYPVVEVALDGQAWDTDTEAGRVRLVVQQGCGCGGQRPYKSQESYTGPLG